MACCMEKYDLHFDTLREIGDLSRDGLLIYNLEEKKVIYANAAAISLTGLREDSSEREIQRFFEFVIADDREYLKNRFADMVKSSATLEVEFKLKKHQREEIEILCCNAFQVHQGSCIVASIRDITKPKQHETYLVEFGAKKNTLLDTLTHHISGALNLMQHLAGQAEKSLASSDNKNLKTYLSLVSDNTRHCIDIINDLLNEEHLESPQVYVKYSRINVVQVIDFIYQELVQSFRDRDFIFKTPSPGIYINTDEVKLLQVVNNLTSNAVKFTPPGSPISIEIEEKSREVIISVKDHGIGIPLALQPFVFERQSVAGRTGLNGEKSNGMGLSICKNLVQLMGGKIWFESNEGAGSTFYCKLPRE
jgi:two-component system, OmpR family, sensor histidine kinase VicK